MQRVKKFKVLYQGFLLVLMIALFSAGAGAADDTEERRLFEDLKAGNHFVLLRHALAPGVGDPEDFKLDDCSTQRNLSSTGRDQAVKIGLKFKQAGISEADVYTSQWCRCLETADLLGLGTPETLPALNSFFRDYVRKDQQTETLRKWLAKQKLEKPLILVTHQVNITAFSTIYPESGEIVLMRRDGDGRFQVAGSIPTK